ncbi:MAG TPA: sulfite exporter TauE/SafE family protein [Actinomycetota bacterium]|nr:sulfite exporter TauE/SafE family protein [Actinomycetota bacterium]
MRAPGVSTFLVAGAIGIAAGLLSGLLGVGGGIVMVPLLVAVVGLTQHEAHATSLAAIAPIAAVGALRFALAGSVDLGVAVLLAAGSLAGAPLGARVLRRASDNALKAAFGALMIAVAAGLLLA